jgi:hypothetical protein
MVGDESGIETLISITTPFDWSFSKRQKLESEKCRIVDRRSSVLLD